MNRHDQDLSLRKEVLLARSSLCRMKARYHAEELRASLSWRGAGATVASSPAARDAVFLIAAAGLGPTRTARWIAWAGRALVVARLAVTALALLRNRS